MNFEDEDYVRLYTRDTVTMKKIGWEGRAVLSELMRKVERSGVLELEEGDDVAEAVAALCDLPVEIARTGLGLLASRGVTRRHGASLVLVRFVEAQNARRSDRLRAQDYRDRQKGGRSILPEENEYSSRYVTGRHDSSLLPSPLLSPASPPPAEDTDARDAPAAASSAPAVRGLVPARRPAPTNQQDACKIPLAERARLVLEDPGNGAWSSPQTWPETIAVAEALAKAAGHKRPRLGDCSRDAGVRAVLQLFADGWPVDELKQLMGAVARSKWWREGGAARGLSSITGEVLRRTENDRPAREGGNMDPAIAREIAKTRAMAAEIGNGGT